MPVLEVTKLRLKGVAATDPNLLKQLSSVRSKLETNSQFLHCIEDTSAIFILGIWPSLEAHHQFLASPERDEVLGPQEELLEFKWTIHMELDAMSSLPLDAPVVGIARLSVHQGRQHKQTIADDTKPYNVVDGWRCDSEPGKYESLVFTGWQNAQAHAAFTAKTREAYPDYAAVRDCYEGSEVYHARNMEDKDF